jgi:hypothetical protein
MTYLLREISYEIHFQTDEFLQIDSYEIRLLLESCCRRIGKKRSVDTRKEISILNVKEKVKACQQYYDMTPERRNSKASVDVLC